MIKDLIFTGGFVAECALVSLMVRSLNSGKRAANNDYLPLSLIVHILSVAIVMVTVDEARINNVYMMVYVMLLVINIVVLAVHEIIVLRNREMQTIIDEKQKADSELESYKRMYEKYEKTRILRHDFKEQISTLKTLIEKDNKEAMRFADKLAAFGRELDFAEYTDNKVLNILLDRKIEECNGKGINLYIKSNGVSMEFLKELDTVAIFSNIINNAMESCVNSAEKNIFVDFTTLNDAFTVIKIENNCDIPPKVSDNLLITGKADTEMHGVGMKSIEASVKNYQGNISWSYDEERHFFQTVIMFNRV